ncbi:single-stranded DNA-binding protein [Actinomadura syzygii]|uniref:Single-stranded DNA-binding protein n=1 Tax=Actinomadura syzygii TaxID=1427538 RepID=A0A5D0TTE4_9ACTN|nr:single-stranded DNA-binding protein [Actinomadura syzygii]TYC08602.1 single-stranded DNA-binding protein [Actinomadura syzygii]
MSNPVNTGTVIGRLARDVKIFSNQDGSKKVAFTVYADRNYKNAQGETPADAIPVEAFVRKDTDVDKTPFAMIHRGDLIALDTSLRMDHYTNRAGEEVFELKVNVENIKLLEPKRVTQARLAQRVADAEQANRQMQAQATVPVPTAVPAQVAAQSAMHDQLPFGNRSPEKAHH